MSCWAGDIETRALSRQCWLEIVGQQENRGTEIIAPTQGEGARYVKIWSAQKLQCEKSAVEDRKAVKDRGRKLKKLEGKEVQKEVDSMSGLQISSQVGRERLRTVN